MNLYKNMPTHPRLIKLICVLVLLNQHVFAGISHAHEINIPYYIKTCAPHVAITTMQAIIKTESKNNSLAIGLNKGVKLEYQPKSYNQAVKWVKYLEKHHYNFDVGLAQINIKNVHKYGYTATDALNPCINITLAARILQKNYKSALHTTKNKQAALLKAISAYNTGNNISGFHNGYVHKILQNAP